MGEGLTFFIYARGLGKPLDGWAILVLCRQELQMFVWLARAATFAAFRRKRERTIRRGGGWGQSPCTHSCKRRTSAFPPCALREEVDTPEQGHWDATGTSGFGILQCNTTVSILFVPVVCDRPKPRTRPTFGNQKKMLLDNGVFVELWSRQCAGASVSQSGLRSYGDHMTDQDHVFRTVSFVLQLSDIQIRVIWWFEHVRALVLLVVVVSSACRLKVRRGQTRLLQQRRAQPDLELKYIYTYHSRRTRRRVTRRG
jgi:hypothetical protein